MDISYAEEAAPLISRYGIPAAVRDTRKLYQKQLAVYIILASTLFERMAFYSLMNNISLTLKSNTTTSEWDPMHSPNALLYIFSGTSYIFTLIFAVISDAKLGRARTIIIGFVLYLSGYTLVTVTAFGITPYCSSSAHGMNKIPLDSEQCAPAILGALIFTAIGAGAVKSNLAVFGAEQIQESKTTSRYFDKCAVAVNIGSMIATLVIPLIPETSGNYLTGYIVAASMPVAAAILFLIGWRFYIHVNPYESVITKCIPVVINAFQSWYKFNQEERSTKKKNKNASSTILLNASQSLTDEERSVRIEHRPSAFLDFAKAVNHGKFHDRIVDDVKSLQGAFIVFSLLIPFWLIFNQVSTTFLSQGEHMRGSEVHRTVNLVTLGDPVTIIVGILILNIFVYKYLNIHHRSLTIVTKFIIGMCFASLSMCIAGTVEVFRQQGCHEGPISDLSIYYQILQSVCVGLSQLFAMVASFEYAYFAAPLSAQSLFMSLHFCSIGIASYIGVAYIAVFSYKSQSNANVTHDQSFFQCLDPPRMDWSLYSYFYILAGLQLIFIIIFILCQKKFRIIKLNPQQVETNQFLQHSSISTTSRQ